LWHRLLYNSTWYIGLLGCGQVCLKWDAEDAADDDVNAFQLLVDGAPVGELLKKPARQVSIDELKPGQELDVSLVPLDSNKQPLGSSNVVKVCAFSTVDLNNSYAFSLYTDYELSFLLNCEPEI